MAPNETQSASITVLKKPLYIVPKITSERWSDGIWNVEQSKKSDSLYIDEDDLLSFSEREERETRGLIFNYQVTYAQKEFELMQEEFQKIEKRLKKLPSPAEQTENVSDNVFKQPHPSQKTVKSEKKTRATGNSSGSDSSSGPRTPSGKTRRQN